ncbi:MAG: cysteine desulfurase [Candidatus Colwellbacteria bacterium]|nr:cysteine desulfurase [Candidatus Colwellbacteria bacterium]
MKRIYLDYAGSTPVAPGVFRAMKPYFENEFGNPGSIHYFGQKAMAGVDRARDSLAKTIGARADEIIFTGSATEANNLAIKGVLKSSKIKHPRIIVSAIEHESVLKTAESLREDGVEVICLPVNHEGFVDKKKLTESLSAETVLVSVIYASNEIGAIQPIKEIAQTISDFRIRDVEHKKSLNPKSSILNPIFYPLLHTDAVQAFQFLECDVNSLRVDMMTLSAQKIYGPKGVGLLYVRGLGRALHLSPLVNGSGQEFGLRSGTENVPGIVGFGKAAELIGKNKKQEAARIKRLRDYFWAKLRKSNPEVELNGPATDSDKRLHNNLNVYFPGRTAQDLLIRLDIAGLAVSSGSACLSRSARPSHVVQALGFSGDRAKASLRITLGRPTKKVDIDKALKLIQNLI